MSESLRAIGLVLRNRELRRLQLAWAGSMLGTCAYLIALTVIAFRSGGATAVGLLMLARMAASAIASPPLSTLADRYPRRLVMASSDLTWAAILMAVLDPRRGQSPVAAVYVLAILISVVGTAFRPAQAALIPSLAATPEELTASNALAGTIEGAGIFVGPGIGGLVLAASGTAAVFALCVIGAFSGRRPSSGPSMSLPRTGAADV